MKTKQIIAVCFLAILINSCSEDFLTIPSTSSLTTTTFFKTQDDFSYAVNGIYSQIAVWGNSPQRGSISSYFLIGDLHSDNSRYYYNAPSRANPTILCENAADFVPDSQTFSENWNTFYKWINCSNQVLDLIDGVTFDQAAKDNLKGQSLFLRAYSYWWLVRLYGDACLHLKSVTSVDEASLPLSPEADVIAQIIDDATLASTLLKDKATQEAGRVTSGTARMLLAEVNMWQQQWSSAETQLMSLTSEYSLMPKYTDVTDPAKKNNAESIFEIQYSSVSADYSNQAVYSMFPEPIGYEEIKALTGVSNPQRIWNNEGFNAPTPDLIALYEAGDKRFAASILYVHNEYGVAVPMCKKYLHPHALFEQTDDNIPVYRYAEALLFLAEAINEQDGRSGIALGYLNQVRNRAGLANSTASTQSEIRDAILKERQIELAFEGKRWFDLVRTGKAVDVITAYGERVKANPLNYYFTLGVSPVPSAFTNITTKFNIPDKEKLINPYID